MKIIKPTKGISQKLVLHGMYENYFLIFASSVFFSFLADCYSVRLLLAKYEDGGISFGTFLIINIFLISMLTIMYSYFYTKTKKEETKRYPKGHVRVSNKNF